MKLKMRSILILLFILLAASLETYSQNIFFIGENSYPSTETFTLQSNSDNEFINDLNIVFAKEGTKQLIIVSSKLVSTVRISGKLIIYLNDGTVISCVDRGIKDNVNDIASSAYYLTNDELTKMKNSNIHTIRYSIECVECLVNPVYEGNYSASNKEESKCEFTTIISEFYSKN